MFLIVNGLTDIGIRCKHAMPQAIEVVYSWRSDVGPTLIAYMARFNLLCAGNLKQSHFDDSIEVNNCVYTRLFS